jgi:hypothetical protein
MIDANYSLQYNTFKRLRPNLLSANDLQQWINSIRFLYLKHLLYSRQIQIYGTFSKFSFNLEGIVYVLIKTV